MLTGTGSDWLLSWLESRARLAAAVGLTVVAGGLAWSAVTLVRLHPQQYLFYNHLVGGLEGASQRSDTDY